MTVKEVFEALAAPFHANEVKSRSGKFGTLSYITARTARRRLNDVLGPENWECKIEASEHWVKCTLTIVVPRDDDANLRITRDALGGYPDMPSEEDRVKGGDSDAFKRACVLFGIGEYLYGEEAVHEPVKVAHDGSYTPKKAEVGQWFPPKAIAASAVNKEYSGGQLMWPKTGTAFYSWFMKVQDKYHWKSLGAELKENFIDSPNCGFPKFFKDWNPAQVQEGAVWVAKGCAMDKDLYHGEFDEHIGVAK